MASAINYLHHNKIMHRDLKPANVLVDNDDNAIVADFDLASDIDGNYKSEVCGTTSYLAPEVLGNQYNQAVDLWMLMLGLTIFFLYAQQHAFVANTPDQAKQKIRDFNQLQYDQFDFTSEAVSFLKKLITDSQKRLRASEVLKKDYLKF